MQRVREPTRRLCNLEHPPPLSPFVHTRSSNRDVKHNRETRNSVRLKPLATCLGNPGGLLPVVVACYWLGAKVGPGRIRVDDQAVELFEAHLPVSVAVDHRYHHVYLPLHALVLVLRLGALIDCVWRVGFCVVLWRCVALHGGGPTVVWWFSGGRNFGGWCIWYSSVTNTGRRGAILSKDKEKSKRGHNISNLQGQAGIIISMNLRVRAGYAGAACNHYKYTLR